MDCSEIVIQRHKKVIDEHIIRNMKNSLTKSAEAKVFSLVFTTFQINPSKTMQRTYLDRQIFIF